MPDERGKGQNLQLVDTKEVKQPKVQEKSKKKNKAGIIVRKPKAISSKRETQIMLQDQKSNADPIAEFAENPEDDADIPVADSPDSEGHFLDLCFIVVEMVILYTHIMFVLF